MINQDGKDGGDEDDHDPAEIPVEQIFDLALAKVLNTTETPGPFAPASAVTFTITVTNQGTLAAQDIQISDYIPAGLNLSDPNWTESAGIATLVTPIPSLAAGASTTVDIDFTIDASFSGFLIRNWAEISAASNVLDLDDVDSTPDDINFNDPGETDDLDDNDVIDEDGLNGGDEDDHDPAQIQIGQIFDLALTKSLNTDLTPGPFSPGDAVTFELTVYNQGSLEATDIQITDYIPSGLTLNDSNWSDTNGEARLNTPIPSLAAQSSTSVNITFTIDPGFIGLSIRNWAEISDASNDMNIDDIDSTPDDINFSERR